MTTALLDDHLLRDVAVGEVRPSLAAVLRRAEPATTNLYLFRLCRSAVAARGGHLTRDLPEEVLRGLARQLTDLGDDVQIVPMRVLTSRMAELAQDHRVSTLGAEVLAAAEHLGATICAWDGDVGPAIRSGAEDLGLRFRALKR